MFHVQSLSNTRQISVAQQAKTALNLFRLSHNYINNAEQNGKLRPRIDPHVIACR